MAVLINAFNDFENNLIECKTFCRQVYLPYTSDRILIIFTVTGIVLQYFISRVIELFNIYLSFFTVSS